MSAVEFWMIVMGALACVGFTCLGYLWAAGEWFPRWKRGFEEGYELAKEHYTTGSYSFESRLLHHLQGAGGPFTRDPTAKPH